MTAASGGGRQSRRRDREARLPVAWGKALPNDQRMRRLLIRSVLSVLALAILAAAWIVAGPWWARTLDAIHTSRLATVTSFSIRKESGFFRFRPGRDGAPLPEAQAQGFTWYEWGNPLELAGIRLDPGGVLVLIDGDRRFVLGRCPCAIEDHGLSGISAYETEGAAGEEVARIGASLQASLAPGALLRSS